MRELVERNDAGVYVRAGDAGGPRREGGLAARQPGRGARAWARTRGRSPSASSAATTSRERALARARGGGALTELSYCVVNTNGRDYLLDCLAAIERTHPEGVEHEVLVLDNASDDGSADAVRERYPDARLFALERRTGKAENDSTPAARGARPLLPAAERGLGAARRAPCGRCSTRSRPIPAPRWPARSCSTRTAGRCRAPGGCPTFRWALAAARVPAGPRGRREHAATRVREVGWVQSSAALVRRDAAEQVGWLDPDFFVYSDETDFCKRLRDAGWRILFVPAARAVHHDQLSTDAAAMARRIVEFHRNRDLYFRKHGLRRHAARLEGVLDVGVPRARGGGRACCPDATPRRYLLHARQELFPGRGEGIRDAAEARNRALANNVPARHGAR